LQADRTGRDWR